ncbi:MAG: glucose-1-phosphate adenylyltransferase subunit GlgD [Clostridia bacterium]|nr:glucose-1-phosphate adenylyltransferase subunit GlgD [Clostridia bacterium]
MRTSAVAGLIFANSDDKLKELTANRSLASVPFGARYRVVDFALSNLVNTGVTSVGIITTENYRSLMDHVGNGIAWDLDRKNGGVYFIPPYYKRGVKRFADTISALVGAYDYIKKCGADYIVLYDSHIIANIDLSAALKAHKKREADVTVIYHNGKLPEKSAKKMILSLNDDERVNSITFSEGEYMASFGIGISIINKDLLLKLIRDAEDDGLTSFAREVIAEKTSELKIYGFEHSGYTAIMDNAATYYEASMDLLCKDIRAQLFDKTRPIFTKVRDGMPTRHGVNAKVSNCIIGDDCVIEGTVKNSILFRGVKIGKDAVVENCILMQETEIGNEAQVSNVIADKNVVVADGVIFKGTKEKLCFIDKKQIL